MQKPTDRVSCGCMLTLAVNAGIHFLTPISGVIQFNPTVQIQLLNAKEVTSFYCRYIPYAPGWDQNALNGLPSHLSLVNTLNGVKQNVTYQIPDDSPASLVRASRILCGIPDGKLLLANGFDAAQLWVEVAETMTLSGIDRRVYTTNRQIFELFRPPNVTGASVRSSPYNGGTVVYVYGQGFRSYLGLSCQSLWCLDFESTAGIATCKSTTFSTAMYINTTTVRCTSGPYFAADLDCNTLCGPGGPDAPYRRVPAVANLEIRKIPYIDCCGETCCKEVTRLQVAVNGVDYIPTSIVRGVPAYTMLANAPKIMFTQYAVPQLYYVRPPVAPMNGGLKVILTGNNLFPASENFTANFSFCRFGVYTSGGHSMEYQTTPLMYDTSSSVSCHTPTTVAPVSTLFGITLNGQIFQTAPGVMFSFFKVAQLEPFFGGFLGGTLMRATGPYMNMMEGVPSRKYQCRFELLSTIASSTLLNNSNATRVVPASFSPPDAILCYTPTFMLGPSRVSISLSDNFFSTELQIYDFVDEALVTVANPNVGPLTGGFEVLITGTNFINSTLLACRFNNANINVVIKGANTRFISNTTVGCIAPAVPISGPTQIYVLNNGQQDSPTSASFMFFEVLSVLPDGGVVEGGTQVRVTLSTSTEGGWCKFGTYVAPGLLIESDGSVMPPYNPVPVPNVICNETMGNLVNNISIGTWGAVKSFEYSLTSNTTWVNGTWVNGTWVPQGPWINGSWVNGTWIDAHWFNGTNGTWANGTFLCYCNATSSVFANKKCSGLAQSVVCSRDLSNETHMVDYVVIPTVSLECYCNATSDALVPTCQGRETYKFCNGTAANETYLTSMVWQGDSWGGKAIVCYCNDTTASLAGQSCTGRAEAAFCNGTAPNGTYAVYKVERDGYWASGAPVCYCNATSANLSCSASVSAAYCSNANVTYVSGYTPDNSLVETVSVNGSVFCYCNGTNQSCAGTDAVTFCNASGFMRAYSTLSGSLVEGIYEKSWVQSTWVQGVFVHVLVPGAWVQAVHKQSWSPGETVRRLHVNHTWVPGTWVKGYWAVNQTWQNGSYGPGYWVNQTWVPGYWVTTTEPLPRGCYNSFRPLPPKPRSAIIECTTTPIMSPSIGGGAVTFYVSLNNRDFAVSPEFEVFTFYPGAQIEALLPQSGPFRGGTGVTAIGTNFFNLCKTGVNPITGVCYKCNQEGSDTFLWTNASSCKVTIPTVAPEACGKPCRTGKDDRSAFGTAGLAYCRFGTITVPARFMTSGRMKCFSPRTPNASYATRLPFEISFNAQQYTNNQALFSWYTITGLSPRSGPTYGDTIISIKGHNLFSGAQNSKQIQCQFWLDILQLGAYDEVNDVVTCPVPEQPAEMRDNGDVLIEVIVTLNFRIPDQFTLTQLEFEYYEEPMALKGAPEFGPMNGGNMLYRLTLPLLDTTIPDYHHQSFPYKYPHFHAKTFLNGTSLGVEPTMCFGVVTVSTNTQLVVPVTCCDDPDTDEPCDGSIARGTYVSPTTIEATVPPFKSPATVAVELSTNGYADGRLNPNAQWTRQSYCTPKVFSCVQASAEARCIDSIACGGIIFKVSHPRDASLRLFEACLNKCKRGSNSSRYSTRP